jgi:hypothetical protein
MSFSFLVKGTREECIEQLHDGAHRQMSADGQVALGLVLAFVVDAPASSSQATPVLYEIAGHGHRDPYRRGLPTLSLHLTTLVAEQDDPGRHVAAGDPEVDVDVDLSGDVPRQRAG